MWNAPHRHPREKGRVSPGCLVVGLLPLVLIAAYVFYARWEFHRQVDMGGKRNRLTCEVRTTDGSSLPEVTLVFKAGDGIRYVPLSGMAGGSPDYNITKDYTLTTTAPGTVTLEWPRLFLHLVQVRIDGDPAESSQKYGSHGYWKAAGPSLYTATLTIDPAKKTFTITQPEEK